MKRRSSDSAATILIAEDDASQRVLLRHILAAEGHTVLEAADGVEALALMMQSDPDLVITDCEMPRMDGLTLVRTIRDDPSRAGLPIVMLTARAAESARLAGLESGVDDYLPKGCARGEVTARVRNLLRLRRALRRVEEQNEDLRRAMRALEESQKRAIAAENLAALGTVAMGLCHELNNPLAVVRTNLGVLGDYVDVLLAGGAEREAIAADAPLLREESLEACARVRAVTEQFAAIHKIEPSLPRRRVALDSALRVAITVAERRSEANIRFEEPTAAVMTAGVSRDLSSCLAVILGRFAALARTPVTATLTPSPAPGEPPTLVLTSDAPPRAVDATTFFDPAHVAAAGRVSYDFALVFARDLLVNMGADIDVASAADRMQATIVFPAP